MHTNKNCGLISPLLLAAVLCGSLGLGVAQTKPAPHSKPKVSAPAQTSAAPDKVWVKDPNSIMPMRKMTNAEHRAAAERNKTRQQHAEASRKQSQTNTQSGVKQ